ncbi:MAG: glycosyltransferase [Bacteroidales bacterium]|nr:glycosyltransferase [Bacteroidales bacterium]
MKICISVTNDVFTDQRVNRTVCSLVSAGYTVSVIGRKKSSGMEITMFPCKVKRLKLIFNRGPLFYAEFNIRLFFLLLFIRADVFLACDLDTLAANYLAVRIRRKTLVYDSHEYFTEVPELVGRSLIRNIWETIEKRILPHIRYSYTVSQSIADAYLMKYGIRMEVIRNYAYRRKSFIQPGFSLKRGKENIILYQGSVNVGRGLDLAISAMKFVENARLVIAGDGDILQDLIRQARRESLLGKILFCGRIPIQNLFLFTLQADIGISLEEDMGLNYRYALPNKLFDYIQAGVPVLVSDLPEMASVVQKYDIGRIIKTTDPRELASCFSAMLNNKDDRNRWKENLLTAAEELCWEKEESKLLELFRKAVNSEQ